MKLPTSFPALLAVVALSLGTSALGCAKFDTPRHDAQFGRPPADYGPAVKQYMLSHLDFPDDARIRIGKPRRAYMNEGAWLGGKILWVGYLVDVHVQSVQKGFRRSEDYVIRMRDGEIVEVHSANNLPVLHEM